ncbi:hypothetical protein [Aurantibacillus circumpalustris]|uniref:hypothetical protein n=1 Tax=Aurantibacillus circumpalustris TaxID=3036359 RepID=UPI00295B9C4D|nr:hypothetical protein [Aurantibacillus circumpalustris]
MILDQFYEVLMARLNAKVTEIKHIDMYDGQYDNPHVDENGNIIDDSFPRPALFIQFPPSIELQALSMRRKTATIVFSLHLVQDVVQEITKRTPALIRAKAHAHKILVDKLQYFIEGFNGNNVVSGYNQFDAISWIGMNPYIKIGQQITDVLHFRVRLTSDNSRITYTKLQELTPPILDPTDDVTHEFDDLDPETL